MDKRDDSNEASIPDGKDFKLIRLYKNGNDLESHIKFYGNIQLHEFFYYFDTDADSVAEILVRCKGDRFEVAAETKPGLHNKVLYTGKPAVKGNSYTLVFPWQKAFENLRTVKFWLFAMDGRDRLPDSGSIIVNW